MNHRTLSIENKTTVITGSMCGIDYSLTEAISVTDLITEHYKEFLEEWVRVKKIFNIIADRVKNVSPWLAKRMLANEKNGAVLGYSSTWKLLWRLVSQPLVRRDLFR